MSTTIFRYTFIFGVTLLLGALVLAAVMSDQGKSPQTLATPISDKEIIAASQGISGHIEPRGENRRLLEEAAAAGNPLAQNNLAVIYMRSRAPGSRDQAIQLLDEAVAKALIAARYNRALLMPSRHDTPPEDIQARLDLLQANVEAGDVHSMVLLANSLYFRNRDEVQRDRAGYKLGLLAVASQSDDPVYVYLYGDELWETYRRDEPVDLARTLDVLLHAHDLGEPRAAYTIGKMLQIRDPLPVVAHLLDQGQSVSALTWFDRAASAGMWAASCGYVRHIEKTIIGNQPAITTERSMGLWVNKWLDQLPISTQAKWVEHLEICAQPDLRDYGPNPPFGNGALYARKVRGGWPALHLGWPENADWTLANLYRFGANPDREKASFHLERTIDAHGAEYDDDFLDLFFSGPTP